MSRKIIYPSGCRPITEELSPEELIRRLKCLADTFQAMSQDSKNCARYKPLALHIIDDFFLEHPNKDVQLLIACCIADVLRVYAPEAPYKNTEQIKKIFRFFIKQLSGLKNPKDPSFKRYFYLLENLAYVKSFNMCFELVDNQEIFCSLFKLLFCIVNDEHSTKVKLFMLDILCPLISESDIVSHELLDIILINIVEPNKTQSRNGYALVKELINRCADTLEPYIQVLFNQVLLSNEEPNLSITSKIYDLIYELNKICPSILLAVLPQLECKIKSTQESERLTVTKLLAKIFSEKNSHVAKNNAQLWIAFLGRFNDISPAVRIKCVQYITQFLLNQPDLRNDILEVVKSKQHDIDENVRYEVVVAVVNTAKYDLEVLLQNNELLECIRERTLDKKFKIRKEALNGLAMIYRNNFSQEIASNETVISKISWIKNKILHGYYMPSMEDRLLVEKLLNTSLIPYQLPPENKMKKLYNLIGTIDDNAWKAFVEVQKNLSNVRNHAKEWLEVYRKSEMSDKNKEISARIIIISRFLPEPLKVKEYLHQLSDILLQDQPLLLGMETILRPNISCEDCAETVNLIMKKIGQPVATNSFYNTVKMLLERMSSVMIDSGNLKILISYVEDCIKGRNIIKELSLNPVSAGKQGLDLLVIFSQTCPYYFFDKYIVHQLINLLKLEEEYVIPLVLIVLTFLGKYKPLNECLSEEMDLLIPICKKFVLTGTKKQAKQAIRCLYFNAFRQNENIFDDIFENIKINLTPSSENYLVSIVSLGHIAQNLPQKYAIVIKYLISKMIIRSLLLTKRNSEPEIVSEANWCPENDLPLLTLCKIEGMKLMARWLLGLQNDLNSAETTFRIYSTYIDKEDKIYKSEESNKYIYSKAEISWLRLVAGCSMLKVAEQKGVGDQFTAEQFYSLSRLMHDDELKVREIFNDKLYKGLTKGFPHRNIPLYFLGLYALGGLEKDKQLKERIKRNISASIYKRREFIKNLTLNSCSTNSYEAVLSQSYAILPDYMLVFAIAVLAHCPYFTDAKSIDQLLKMKQCLWFIMEPLIMKNENYCYNFYINMLYRLKTLKDAITPNDDVINEKIWTLSDLAMTMLLKKTSRMKIKDVFPEVKVSSLFFAKVDDPSFNNDKCYLPSEFITNGMNQGRKKPLTSNSNVKKENSAKGKRNEVDYDNIPSKFDKENSDAEPAKKRRMTRAALRNL